MAKLALITVNIFILLFTVACHEAVGYSIFIDSSHAEYDSGIPAWLTSWGNTVTVVSDYMGEDLSPYDIVMDYDYSTYYPLTSQEKAAYSGVLNRGAGLYLQGERPTGTYYWRDISVLSYLTELGAGSIAVNWIDSYANVYDNFQTAVPSPVTRDTSLKYAINRSLAITDPGNGFFVVHTNELTDPKSWPVVSYFGEFSNLIGFDKGQLANAPAGRLIASFDISGMSDLNQAGWSTNQYLFKEVVTYLGNSRSVTLLGDSTAIPEPSTLVLICSGGALFFFQHHRSRR